jgi:hypothetical protein
MMNYLFPPAHAAQWALPALYLGRPPVAEDGYWAALATNAEEACAYVGVVPLIFACLGLFAGGGNRRAFSLWSVLGLGAFALASMPAWWPDGFRLLLQIPGLGWFRAPARYTLLTSLTLALLAGRGLGRTITPRSFSLGLCLALAIGLASLIWTVSWSAQASYRLSLGPETIPWRYAGGALAWAVGLTGILVWRAGRVGAWLPITISVVELGALFYAGPIPWGWALRMPEQSPILSRLKQEPEVGLVGGRLKNIPARVGLTTAFPGLGITPPPPNYLLESATDPEEASIAPRSRWLRRFGVTHSVWWANDPSSGEEIARFDRDFALDSILRGDPNVRAGIGWKIVRDPAAFPPAWISSQAHLARAWGELYPTLSNHDLMDTVWFLPEDRPREGDWPKSVWPESHGRVDSLTSPSPPDRIGRVISWDGSRVVVEHGAPAYVVLRRTAYPGWMCRVDNSTKRPVLRGNGGLITIPLLGSGRKTIDVWYEPNGVREATAVSVAALIAALIAITRDCLIQKSPQKRALEPAV